MVQDQEPLIAIKYHRVLQGQENKGKTSQQLKDAKIALLKFTINTVKSMCLTN